MSDVGAVVLETDGSFSVLPRDKEARGPTSLADVRGVMVTHIHPDHYGLAGRVREASGAWVGLHPDDAALLPSRSGSAS